MKRVIRAVSVMLIVAVLFALTGCFGEQKKVPEVELSDLYGTWKYEVSDTIYTIYTFTDAMRYTKKESGNSGAVNSMGKYELNGNQLTIIPSEGIKSTVHEITEFDGSRMVWGNPPITAEYIKE